MRIEEDFIGPVEVPDEAYYGSFTARAKKNFELSGLLVDSELIYAVALIKKCAAKANASLEMLDQEKKNAIVSACEEILNGKLDSQFILDAFQAGAGTPLHMNVNEVVANRANEILGGKLGKYEYIHPNNHVNMAQSSNNVVPSALRIAAIKLRKKLLIEAKNVEDSLRKKSKQTDDIVKIGRTHLQDAVPMKYGQTFKAYANALKKDIELIQDCDISQLGIGGTATGTGITAHPDFRKKIIEELREYVEVEMAEDPIERTQNLNDLLVFSSNLKGYAITLSRIANDLRILASGPKAGIAEIVLQEVEPGSSIMPGKINPSVPEAVNMIAYQVIANENAVMLSAQSGQLELNFCTPLAAYNIIQSEKLLINCSKMFSICIQELNVDQKRSEENFAKTFGYATALNPYLGYKEVSKLVLEAYKGGVTLKELIIRKKIMDEKQLEEIIASSFGPTKPLP